jgi:hypothetical protein
MNVKGTKCVYHMSRISQNDIHLSVGAKGPRDSLDRQINRRLRERSLSLPRQGEMNSIFGVRLTHLKKHCEPVTNSLGQDDCCTLSILAE